MGPPAASYVPTVRSPIGEHSTRLGGLAMIGRDFVFNAERKDSATRFPGFPQVITLSDSYVNLRHTDSVVDALENPGPPGGRILPPRPRRPPRQRSRRLPTAIDDIDLEADSIDRYL